MINKVTFFMYCHVQCTVIDVVIIIIKQNVAVVIESVI